MNKLYFSLLIFFFCIGLGASPKSSLIQELYKDISGFSITSEEREKIDQSGGSPVYGEITFDSVHKMITALELTDKDIFYDLGSGVGKVALQVFLESSVKKSGGIELSHTRAESAKAILESVKRKNLLPANRELVFIEGDILVADISDATVVFMCSTCFPEAFMKKVQAKLTKCKDGLKVVTLKELPESPNFEFVKKLDLEMTWTTETSVYFYKLKKDLNKTK